MYSDAFFSKVKSDCQRVTGKIVRHFTSTSDLVTLIMFPPRFYIFTKLFVLLINRNKEGKCEYQWELHLVHSNLERPKQKFK
jgi:hypothetical protein